MRTFRFCMLLLSFCVYSQRASAGEPPFVISPEALSKAIEASLFKVYQFRDIAEWGNEHHIPIWISGGTAAGLAYYVKLYEEYQFREVHGLKQYVPLQFFNFNYYRIYRSTQDADIIIDGSVADAEILESYLRKKYSYLQGSKSIWEVRLLNQSRGSSEGLKEPILSENFLNQNSDSYSTGMIKLTDLSEGESRIRDAFAWKSVGVVPFLEDMAKGELRYYDNPKHEQTSRFKMGLNPKILSVIRCLNKEFQYPSELRKSDLPIIKKIISNFDPISIEYSLPGLIHSLNKNSLKLFYNSENIERTRLEIDALGLSEKINLFANHYQQNELAYVINRVPLMSKPVGSGQGKTAEELGLTVVAHETRDYLAYESITRSPHGKANVFISRRNEPWGREGASEGWGFYTRKGRFGYGLKGFTIRYAVNPRARRIEGNSEEGDFIQNGDIFVFRNNLALLQEPSYDNLSPLDFMRALADQTFTDKDRGSIEKFRIEFRARFYEMSLQDRSKMISFMKWKLRTQKGILVFLRVLPDWLYFSNFEMTNKLLMSITYPVWRQLIHLSDGATILAIGKVLQKNGLVRKRFLKVINDEMENDLATSLHKNNLFMRNALNQLDAVATPDERMKIINLMDGSALCADISCPTLEKIAINLKKLLKKYAEFAELKNEYGPQDKSQWLDKFDISPNRLGHEFVPQESIRDKWENLFIDELILRKDLIHFKSFHQWIKTHYFENQNSENHYSKVSIQRLIEPALKNYTENYLLHRLLWQAQLGNPKVLNEIFQEQVNDLNYPRSSLLKNLSMQFMFWIQSKEHFNIKLEITIVQFLELAFSATEQPFFDGNEIKIPYLNLFFEKLKEFVTTPGEVSGKEATQISEILEKNLKSKNAFVWQQWLSLPVSHSHPEILEKLSLNHLPPLEIFKTIRVLQKIGITSYQGWESWLGAQVNSLVTTDSFMLAPLLNLNEVKNSQYYSKWLSKLDFYGENSTISMHKSNTDPDNNIKGFNLEKWKLLYSPEFIRMHGYVKFQSQFLKLNNEKIINDDQAASIFVQSGFLKSVSFENDFDQIFYSISEGEFLSKVKLFSSLLRIASPVELKQLDHWFLRSLARGDWDLLISRYCVNYIAPLLARYGQRIPDTLFSHYWRDKNDSSIFTLLLTEDHGIKEISRRNQYLILWLKSIHSLDKIEKYQNSLSYLNHAFPFTPFKSTTLYLGLLNLWLKTLPMEQQLKYRAQILLHQKFKLSLIDVWKAVQSSPLPRTCNSLLKNLEAEAIL